MKKPALMRRCANAQSEGQPPQTETTFKRREAASRRGPRATQLLALQQSQTRIYDPRFDVVCNVLGFVVHSQFDARRNVTWRMGNLAGADWRVCFGKKRGTMADL